jgi:hypothetical protein
MGTARVGQVVERVHLRLTERECGRIHDQHPVAVPLQEPPRVQRIRLAVHVVGHDRERALVADDGLEARELDVLVRAVRVVPAVRGHGLGLPEQVGEPAHVAQPGDAESRFESSRDLEDRGLAICRTPARVPSVTRLEGQTLSDQ